MFWIYYTTLKCHSIREHSVMKNWRCCLHACLVTVKWYAKLDALDSTKNIILNIELLQFLKLYNGKNSRLRLSRIKTNNRCSSHRIFKFQKKSDSAVFFIHVIKRRPRIHGYNSQVSTKLLRFSLILSATTNLSSNVPPIEWWNYTNSRQQ